MKPDYAKTLAQWVKAQWITAASAVPREVLEAAHHVLAQSDVYDMPGSIIGDGSRGWQSEANQPAASRSVEQKPQEQ